MISIRSVALVVGVVACSTTSLASPLNLMQSTPDITSGFITVSYNATSDVLTVTGTALSIDFNGTPPPDNNITSGTFTLTATINSSGMLTSGSLSIAGTIPALGAASPLLTANLTAFGFSDSPVTQIFEFTGTTTGGSQAAGMGSQVGTILNLGGGFSGSFASNFANGGFGSADTFRIPTPGASLLLGAASLIGLSRRRR